jgi:hypothetical protein
MSPTPFVSVGPRLEALLWNASLVPSADSFGFHDDRSPLSLPAALTLASCFCHCSHAANPRAIAATSAAAPTRLALP